MKTDNIIAYVLGCTHGGTTVLHRVLGAHSKITNLGSVEKTAKYFKNNQICSCGETMADYSFFSQLDSAVYQASGKKISNLMLSGKKKRGNK